MLRRVHLSLRWPMLGLVYLSLGQRMLVSMLPCVRAYRCKHQSKLLRPSRCCCRVVVLRRLNRRLTLAYISGCRLLGQPHFRLVRLSLSSSSSELQQVFASGAEAAMVVPPPAPSSRMSRASRRSVASSLAMELFGYSREMTGHVMQMVGQMQDQAQNQLNQVVAQAEAQRAEAKQLEEAQWVEARQREEMLIQMKIATKQANADREKGQLEAT